MRQRCDSKIFRNYIKYEESQITFTPINKEDPSIGGTIQLITREFNFSMFRYFVFNQYGYYTQDKLVFGKFNKE